jgi:uracil-DNA glycosylase
MPSLASLRRDIAACSRCAPMCPAGCRPLVQLGSRASLLIIGQAPGRRAHESGIPWNDPSGKRLRTWLGLDDEQFYDRDRVALMPMGFCYPGSGPSGDHPPPPECAPLWHPPILAALRHVRFTILIGRYAVDRYAGDLAKLSLDEAVRRSGNTGTWILPHPSPRNQRWLRQHPWFEAEHLPRLRQVLAQ